MHLESPRKETTHEQRFCLLQQEESGKAFAAPGRGTQKNRCCFIQGQHSSHAYGRQGNPPEDPDLDGHFPGAPTYPGYAQDEFTCLVAAALIPLSIEGLKTDPYVVQKIVRYKKNAVPGDRLIAEVKLDGRRGKFFMFSGSIKNQNDEIVAEYEKIVGAV